MKQVFRRHVLLGMALFVCITSRELHGETRQLSPVRPMQDGHFGKWVAAKGKHVLVGQRNDVDLKAKGTAYLINIETGMPMAGYLFGRRHSAEGELPPGFAECGAVTETHSLIGAPYADLKGSVVIFKHGEDQPREIKGTVDKGEFGTALSVDGGDVLIGAMGEANYTGAAYLYGIADAKIKHTFKVDGLPELSYFGTSVALTNKYVVIGADYYNKNAGSAWLFDRATGNLLHELKPSVPSQEGAFFGDNIAVSGDRILISAPDSEPTKYHLFDAKTGKELRVLEGVSGTTYSDFELHGDVAIIGDGSGTVHFVDLKTVNVIHKVEDLGLGLGNAVAVDGNSLYLGAPDAKDGTGLVFAMTDWQRSLTAAPKAGDVAVEPRGPRPSNPMEEPVEKPVRTWEKDHRIWTDKTGKHEIDAMYDSYVGNGVIRLRKEDGSTTDVPMSKLSEKDRRFAVQETKEEREAMRKKK